MGSGFSSGFGVVVFFEGFVCLGLFVVFVFLSVVFCFRFGFVLDSIFIFYSEVWRGELRLRVMGDFIFFLYRIVVMEG